MCEPLHHHKLEVQSKFYDSGPKNSSPFPSLRSPTFSPIQYIYSLALLKSWVLHNMQLHCTSFRLRYCATHYELWFLASTIIIIFVFAKLSTSSSFGWTELVLLSVLYQPATTRNLFKYDFICKPKHSNKVYLNNLNYFVNWRRPKLFCKWKTT